METTCKKFMARMILGKPITLNRQNQQNLAEWVIKTAMCHDSAESHSMFFTQVERDQFKATRRLPDATIIFVAMYEGKSHDASGADFALIHPETKDHFVKGHSFTMMLGHLVVQVVTWHLDPQYKNNKPMLRPKDGPWRLLTQQVWPITERAINWPPPLMLDRAIATTHYGYFRERFKNDHGHIVRIPRNPTKR